jgi:hypothetical protein
MDDLPGTDLSTLLLQGEEMWQQLAGAHAQGWGLGTADRWGLDQQTGLITWTFPDRVAVAAAQILGSFRSSEQSSWQWAWANPSILPDLTRDAELARQWGEQHGHAALTTPSLGVDEEGAAQLAAIALRLTRATGIYRGGNGLKTYITFGPVTITDANGSSTFIIDIE